MNTGWLIGRAYHSNQKFMLEVGDIVCIKHRRNDLYVIEYTPGVGPSTFLYAEWIGYTWFEHALDYIKDLG